MSQDIFSALGIKAFRPLPFLSEGRLQTVAGLYWPQAADLQAQSLHRVALPDGDELVVVENRPPQWDERQRIVLLVHGLTGCAHSRYMSRLGLRLTQQGYLVVRMNMRGCGAGFGLARHPYHSGRSEDSRAVVQWLAKRFPLAPLTLVGFSLGGNLSLKMAGEDGQQPSGKLDSVVAVSPPIHLADCARKLLQPQNWMFNKYFVLRLRQDVARLYEKFPELFRRDLPKRMSLVDFDEHYTAPSCGFASAEDYYARCSSLPLLSKIGVPSLILCAVDDPVIDSRCLAGLSMPRNLELVLTRHGGHVGFIGWGGGPGQVRWMDELITRWIVRHDERHP